MSGPAGALDPKDRASFDRIAEIIARIGPVWREQPNVLDIVPALKTTGGYVREDILCIGFHVSEKVPPAQLADRGYQPIPPEIEGVPTDVILARSRPVGSVDTKDTRSQMFDTLVGGIAVGNANMNVYGTLAMTLLAASDGRLVGLTNEHVLVFDGDGHMGDEVQQPRFYLNSEVSLDSAACCPNGQLHYHGVDNPVVDAASAVAVAAAVAAAASDVIDPHRRGQDATVPDPGERTLREVVSMDIDYPQIPFPGRPYSVGVKWRYRRQTDRRVLEHSVDETQQNEHVVPTQELITDRTEYEPADTVTFLALLGAEPGRERCDNYFVTAAALSPTHHKAYKLILRPWTPPVELAELSHGSETHAVRADTTIQCFDYAHQKPGDTFRAPRLIDSLTYDPQGFMAGFVAAGPGGAVVLRFADHGLAVSFPAPVQEVSADVLVRGGEVRLTAYADTTELAAANAGPADATQTLTVSATSIDRIVISGGASESLLLRLCLTRRHGDVCLYRGQLLLAPNEELGVWSTYLYAQTLNDVPLGQDPLTAARTIGGLPVTNNFTDLGQTYNITYGTACNIGPAPYGNFRVVAPKMIS